MHAIILSGLLRQIDKCLSFNCDFKALSLSIKMIWFEIQK